MLNWSHGKTADISIQQNFDASWRGLPYKPRSIEKSDLEHFKAKHSWTTEPSLANVELVYAAVDVMDDFFSYAVFAFDVNDNVYLLEGGELEYLELSDERRAEVNEMRKEEGKPPVITIEDILKKEYLVKDGVGIKVSVMGIDQGGHRGDEVKHFARYNTNVIMWKGTNLQSLQWRYSENQERLVIGNEKFFRSLTIYSLHSQKNRTTNYFFIEPTFNDVLIKQIVGVKPDPSQKWR